MNYTSLSRGQASITLTSPSGTESKLLTPRNIEDGFGQTWNWTYMSVQFWGEDPDGQWKLQIYQGGSYMDNLDYMGFEGNWSI